MEYVYVRCTNTVSDDLGIYCVEGKIYEIFEDNDDYYIIATETVNDGTEMRITKDDNDFEYFKPSRRLDAEIAVQNYGWEWHNMYGIRDILVPPETDERRMWTAMWDEDGLPHWLPKYSEGEE